MSIKRVYVILVYYNLYIYIYISHILRTYKIKNELLYYVCLLL